MVVEVVLSGIVPVDVVYGCRNLSVGNGRTEQRQANHDRHNYPFHVVVF
jgi:hypothetical protein